MGSFISASSSLNPTLRTQNNRSILMRVCWTSIGMLGVSVSRVCSPPFLLYFPSSTFLTGITTDNILITETGYENLTTTAKEVEDMYKLINGS